jgi:anthranilate phosphoribosyltransferase
MSDAAAPVLDIKAALGRVIERQDLGAEDAAAVVGQIMDGAATAAQVGALLSALRMKGEAVDEVVGAAQAMRSRMLRVTSDAPVLLDTCGTGGDGSGSVNVTTLASFVLAACGVKVAKHGNRAMSSRSGSHDVIEALGLDPAPGPELAARCLAEAGLCFMFAPAYHAATKHAAGPRRELGFRTLFNLLGPLTNPAGARYHVNGVFAASRCAFLAQAHKALGSRRALVVHGAGGLDELAPRGSTLAAELREDGTIATTDLVPADFGLPEEDPAGLRGGDAAANARLLLAALSGRRGGGDDAPPAVRTVVLMTAAAGLYVAGVAPDLRAGAEQAAAALDAGAAGAVLERLRALCPHRPA